MKRSIVALAASVVFGAGFLAGSISPFQVAQAQVGIAGMPWPAAAAAPASANGPTHFYAIDTGTRTLISCSRQGKEKPSCVREQLP
jgi:beta-lactamase superfamily II metal-dependent hydrolase